MSRSRYRICAIVEGHGEQLAVPILLKLWFSLNRLHSSFCTDDLAVRAAGQGALVARHDAEGELGVEHYVRLAAGSSPAGILVILDAEGSCLDRKGKPPEEQLGPELLRRAKMVARHIPISVVVANRTYETWFLASLSRLKKAALLPQTASLPPGFDIEAAPRHKSMMARLLGRPYEETIHMSELTNALPLRKGSGKPMRKSRSFGKLLKELKYLTTAARRGYP